MSDIRFHLGESARVVADDREESFAPAQVIQDKGCHVRMSVATTPTQGARTTETRPAATRVGATLVTAIGTTFLLAACNAPSIEVLDRCSLSRSAENPDELLREQLGCGPVFHYYDNEAQSGFRSGLGSLCPDLPDTRAVLRDHQKDGFEPDVGDTCMIVPEGEIFVFWVRDPVPAPGCTSGCTPGYEPLPL